ncbi:hypothetical protein JZ751_020919 [Albula glossodonta]|uniref:Uncharacterized protein n=1 Tax=Albula glossodonta TaxID=121402 RepID=A0A8T2PJ14_9TELE|nr:hypothetical protein JZ751_020919 [Albula glossodonta]
MEACDSYLSDYFSWIDLMIYPTNLLSKLVKPARNDEEKADIKSGEAGISSVRKKTEKDRETDSKHRVKEALLLSLVSTNAIDLGSDSIHTPHAVTPSQRGVFNGAEGAAAADWDLGKLDPHAPWQESLRVGSRVWSAEMEAPWRSLSAFRSTQLRSHVLISLPMPAQLEGGSSMVLSSFAVANPKRLGLKTMGRQRSLSEAGSALCRLPDGPGVLGG